VVCLFDEKTLFIPVGLIARDARVSICPQQTSEARKSCDKKLCGAQLAVLLSVTRQSEVKIRQFLLSTSLISDVGSGDWLTPESSSQPIQVSRVVGQVLEQFLLLRSFQDSPRFAHAFRLVGNCGVNQNLSL
jgi:hypothetical protein